MAGDVHTSLLTAEVTFNCGTLVDYVVTEELESSCGMKDGTTEVEQ